MIIGAYLTPLMNDRYNKNVDILINKILDEKPKVEDGEHYATFHTSIGVVEIWVCNRWYAYASRARLHSKTSGKSYSWGAKQIYEHARPSRRTMVRMAKYIKNQDTYEPNELLNKLVKDMKK